MTKKAFFALVAALAILNAGKPFEVPAFAEDGPQELGGPPVEQAELTTEDLVAELTSNPELLDEFAYLNGLRVDKLFGANSEFTLQSGGFVPSLETWTRWAKKPLKDVPEEELPAKYDDFLKYAAALAHPDVGLLRGCKAAEASEDIPMSDLLGEFTESGGARTHAYCNGRRKGTLFLAKYDVLIVPGGGLRPSFDGWLRWTSAQGVPKKLRPTEADEAMYAEFVRFLPVLLRRGDIK